MDGAYWYRKAVSILLLTSPLLPWGPGSSHLPLPTETSEGNSVRQRMVCCKGCTRTHTGLQRLSNEESKWCFMVCSRYINTNNFTFSSIQVPGYLAVYKYKQIHILPATAIAPFNRRVSKDQIPHRHFREGAFLFLPCYSLLCLPEFSAFFTLLRSG